MMTAIHMIETPLAQPLNAINDLLVYLRSGLEEESCTKPVLRRRLCSSQGSFCFQCRHSLLLSCTAAESEPSHGLGIESMLLNIDSVLRPPCQLNPLPTLITRPNSVLVRSICLSALTPCSCHLHRCACATTCWPKHLLDSLELGQQATKREKENTYLDP